MSCVTSSSSSRFAINSRFSRVTIAQRRGAIWGKGANVVKRPTVFIVLVPKSCSFRQIGWENRGRAIPESVGLTLVSTLRMATPSVRSDSATMGTLCSRLLIVSSGWITMYIVSWIGKDMCATSAAGHSRGMSCQGSGTGTGVRESLWHC